MQNIQIEMQPYHNVDCKLCGLDTWRRKNVKHLGPQLLSCWTEPGEDLSTNHQISRHGSQRQKELTNQMDRGGWGGTQAAELSHCEHTGSDNVHRPAKPCTSDAASQVTGSRLQPEMTQILGRDGWRQSLRAICRNWHLKEAYQERYLYKRSFSAQHQMRK